MKIIILVLTVLMGFQAQAEIIEVNDLEGKVYFAPTPVLQMTIVDLDGEGGLMTAFLDYRTKDIKEEMAAIAEKYPDYQLQTVGLNPQSSTAELQIPAIDLVASVKVNQGQNGPYVNSQIMLNRTQMKKVKDLKSSLAAQAKLNLEVKGEYTSKKLIEEVAVNTSACGGGKVKTVQDVIWYLSDLKKPSSIRYDQTFSSLKQEILGKCFSISPVSINSFTSMMRQPVELKQNISLNARYADSVAQTHSGNLKVKNSVEFN